MAIIKYFRGEILLITFIYFLTTLSLSIMNIILGIIVPILFLLLLFIPIYIKYKTNAIFSVSEDSFIVKFFNGKKEVIPLNKVNSFQFTDRKNSNIFFDELDIHYNSKRYQGYIDINNRDNSKKNIYKNYKKLHDKSNIYIRKDSNIDIQTR